MLPVTLLTGADDQIRAAAAGELLAGDTVLVEYDLTGLVGGSVLRTARTAAGVIDEELIRMGHPCVSCAMRGSLVPLLVSIAATERYGAAIVSVPGAGDTQALAEEIAHDAGEELRVDAVLTVLDPATFPADVSGDAFIHDRGIPTAAEDGRAIAEVLIRQVEYANAVILGEAQTAGAPEQAAANAPQPAAGPEEGDAESAATAVETTRALASALNPQALVRPMSAARELFGVRLHDPDAAEAWVEPGSISAPLQTGGPVRTLVWQSDRPFHPERLYDALEELVSSSARGKGTVWLASQPHARLGWDSFGTNIALGVLGPWLADLPPERWSEVGQTHQARSALEWHPEHGDRASYLSITGVGLDIWELERLLSGCVLRTGESEHQLTDPFAPYLEGSTAA
ncbi:CobW family GTP-binding protein [Kribbella sp. CA-293567]|uniref:CobW family GTP-binding protein n=1 Tax=Kribbella sp. CA-293567 TaxID=3002436 RepID=UPI0022DDC137|nr:GTP-binding protein [Kribbella sp. CA-293567]WBQ05806.1 GTP-binding protein [Kribbella sp. CA-293567]